jgi:uroporphyrinogen-III synthase
MRPRPRVANTRDEAAGGLLATALEAMGLESWQAPTVHIAPAQDPDELTQALAALERMDWVVFTSAHGVDACCDHPEWRRAVNVGAIPRLAAVGRATAARLAEFGHFADCVPDESGASSLASALIERTGTLSGARILWPRADIARRTLALALARAGAVVVAPVAYRTQPVSASALAPLVAEIRAGQLDAIAFCSPSSAEHLARTLGLESLGPLLEHVLVASIGPTTTAALAALGAPPDVEASTPSAPALAAALAARLLRSEKRA